MTSAAWNRYLNPSPEAPAITLIPGEVFVTLDTDGRELRWTVLDTGLVKIQTTKITNGTPA